MMTFSWLRDDSLYLIDPDAFWHHISTPGKHFHWFVLKKGFHTHCHKLCCSKKWCVQIQFFVLLLNLLELHSLLQMCLFQPKTNAFKNTISSVTTTLIKNNTTLWHEYKQSSTNRTRQAASPYLGRAKPPEELPPNATAFLQPLLFLLCSVPMRLASFGGWTKMKKIKTAIDLLLKT